MDIDQNKGRSETRSCYDCNEKGHISRHCPKPQKQQIWSTELTELNLKSLVAEAVAAVDARETGKKAEEPKRVFRQVNGEIHALSDQQVLGLRNKYSRVYQRYVDPTITCYH